MRCLMLQGDLAGQVLFVATGFAEQGVADGWCRDLAGVPYPFDNSGVVYGQTADELPPSYRDWLAEGSPSGGQAPGAPLPTLASLEPATAEIGSADVLLHAIGTGFEDGCSIVFNGGEEPTTFVSATEVTTVVKPSLATGPWTLPVYVRGITGATNSLDFSFTEPVVPPPADGK